MLHWGFPPIIGGVETHLSILGPEIVARGHQVGLLTCTAEKAEQTSDWHGMLIKRTPLMDLNWLYERGLMGLEGDIKRDFKAFLDQVKPDLIHTHNMHYFSKIHTHIIQQEAKERNIPLVLTAHNCWDDIQCLELTKTIKWDHIIAVSHFIKKEICGFGVEQDKVTVIHHGIDGERFVNVEVEEIYKKHPRLRGRRVFFHPARMGLGKGCHTSVKALRLIKKEIPDAMLVLAGTKRIIDWGKQQQKDIAYILNLIKSFNLKNDVLVEVFTREEVAELYQIADFTIYPSFTPEPFGLTMLESMICEKPIIVTDAGGMPEVIKNDVNGFVIRIKDYEALAERAVQLFNDGKLRERLGKTGKKMVNDLYSVAKMTDRVLSLYEKIIQEKAHNSL